MIATARYCGLATLVSLTGVMLAGCGGGGGVASTGTPPATTTAPTDPVVSTPTPVATTPVVTPAPTIPTVNYDDAEYQRSNAAVAASAISAYNAGSSGAGVKIAVLDSGLATVGSEFSGRIDPASRDFGGNTSFADIDGHGTAVTAVAAAARNGATIEGVAWGATILALRTDTAGTCAQADGCDFSTNTLATAIDYARTNGAKVINLSLGGGGTTQTLTAAINRATAAGIVLVIAAGNDGGAEPDALAQVAASASARGLVIIAGSHDAANALSSFSNRAGTFSQFYLAALGSRVRSFDNDGASFLFSGTSFSTPAIAGAIALLAQAFPNLTGAKLVELLYASATDAGASGVDATFGRGLLNLARAFRPVGITTLAGSMIAVGENDASLLSGAMGDASLGQLGQAVVLDSYKRAYAMPVGRTVTAGMQRPLGQTLGMRLGTVSSHVGGFTLSTTVARGFAGEPWAGLAQRGRGYRADIAARPLEATMLGAIDARTRFGFAWGAGAAALDDRLAGMSDGASFVAARAPGEAASLAAGRISFVAARSLGRLEVSASVERSDVPASRFSGQVPPRSTQASLRVLRRIGPLALRLGVGAIDETRTILGARLAPAFGGAGATTRFIEVGGWTAFGGGWQAAARWRGGWTQAAAGGLSGGGTLRSRAATFDLGHVAGVTRFGLRFALPQRVTGGGLRVMLPTGYDYADGAIAYSPTRLSLAPQGHERDVEGGWGAALGGGWLDANLYWRRDPGNIAAAPDDLGAALRFSLTL